MNKYIIYLIVILFSICGHGCKKKTKNYWYSVCVSIQSEGINDLEITGVNCEFYNWVGRGRRLVGSYLVSGAPYHYPIPEKVAFTWKDDEGQDHRVEVEVKNKLPDPFEGDLIFTILENDQVNVSYKKK